MIEAVLELKDVCFRWPTQNRATIDLPELKIDQGERIFLQGPSGSGKSTLLSLGGGILGADPGTNGASKLRPVLCIDQARGENQKEKKFFHGN